MAGTEAGRCTRFLGRKAWSTATTLVVLFGAAGTMVATAGPAHADSPPPAPVVPGILLPPQFIIPGLFPEIHPAPPEHMKSVGERALEAAESKIGSAYRSGAAGPDDFDCSGLVQWAYRQVGVDLPRTSYDQLSAGTPVDLDALQPGDLVSFYGGGHSALYAGDGAVVHAATSGEGVIRSAIAQMPVTGARRF
ncbi:Probable endopeptidase cgR_2070 precursor [Nocardia africana]|uniref:Probable endopeptidase cgR_2070 n=2 Tax=Nocardia africana TaxID=134964 RepID=A0A378WM84_9NOCA|nr:NlpC/P60 family protein [Nocardia africana]MCC3315973.1 NlpC/P60 family protein [Nocardia africana]SUA41695.1 Probable endopeptidase cgR_2070 precursor [Nocardia africana]